MTTEAKDVVKVATRTMIKKGKVPVVIVPSIANPKAKEPFNTVAPSGYTDVLITGTRSIQRVADKNLATEKLAA